MNDSRLTSVTERPCRVELTRRAFLGELGGGLGSLALLLLLRRHASAESGAGELSSASPHHAPRAKRIIYMHMVGGTSQNDLFDPKPVLRERDGELCPDELFVGKQLAFIRERPRLLGSPYAFAPSGKSGVELSELLPRFKRVVDDVTIIRSMHTDQINHAPAQLMLLSGFGRFGRPSVGSWISYGLGSENENLPSFVVLTTGTLPGAGNAAWGAGFLPSVHQGVALRSQGDPVLFLADPPGVSREDRRDVIDTVAEMNQRRLEVLGDPEIETRVSQYEMAYRMQTSVPAVMDIWQEPESVHRRYGTARGKATFANNCLLARRLIEQGVRFVQLFDSDWDHHAAVFSLLPVKCRDVDRPIAALIGDLKERGLLEDTLVIWATEFGRTPMAQGKDGEGRVTSPGRDHHREAFTVCLAGGGVKAGFVHGETDELGHSVVKDPVHVHDLNATVLHLLGIDHKKLTFRFQGREYRLTDVHGELVHGILA